MQFHWFGSIQLHPRKSSFTVIFNYRHVGNTQGFSALLEGALAMPRGGSYRVSVPWSLLVQNQPSYSSHAKSLQTELLLKAALLRLKFKKSKICSYFVLDVDSSTSIIPNRGLHCEKSLRRSPRSQSHSQLDKADYSGLAIFSTCFIMLFPLSAPHV